MRIFPASKQAEAILNKEAGWKALTGTTDFSEIAVENPPTQNHKLAFEIVIDRLLGYIGSYFVKLDGQVDALVFAGGVGENSSLLRKRLVERCRSLGFAIDEAANSKGAEKQQAVTEISKVPGGEAPRVLICQTNEQVSQTYFYLVSRYFLLSSGVKRLMQKIIKKQYPV